MPKSKKRKKHGVPVRPAGVRSLAQSAANWPLYECLINAGWQNTEDLTQVVVARRNPFNGVVVGAMFLVDLGCLGVKDATVLRFDSTAHFRHTLEGSLTLLRLFVPASLDLAAKVLREAAAYGRSLGFVQHGDYIDALALLQGAQPESVSEEVPLGRDGKPFYVAGPDDHPGKILRQLDKAVGPGNYDYTVLLPAGMDLPLGIDPAKISLLPLDDDYAEERISWLPQELLAILESLTPDEAIELFRPIWPNAVAREFLEQGSPEASEQLAGVPPDELADRLRALLPLPLRAYFDGLVNAVPESLVEYLDLLEGIDATEPDDEIAPEILAKLASADPRVVEEADSTMLGTILDDLTEIVPARTLNAIRNLEVESAIPALLAALPDDLRGILAPQLNLILELRAQTREPD